MKGNVCYFNLAVFLVTFQRILHRLVTKCQVQCCTSLPMNSPEIVYIFCISLCNNDIILSEHVMRLIVVPFWDILVHLELRNDQEGPLPKYKGFHMNVKYLGPNNLINTS